MISWLPMYGLGFTYAAFAEWGKDFVMVKPGVGGNRHSCAHLLVGDMYCTKLLSKEGAIIY